MRNKLSGTGNSISRTEFPTVTTEYTGTDGYPRGFKVATTGKVKIKLPDDDTFIETYCVAGAYNNYEIAVIYGDGAVPITDIEVYF